MFLFSTISNLAGIYNARCTIIYQACLHNKKNVNGHIALRKLAVDRKSKFLELNALMCAKEAKS